MTLLHTIKRLFFCRLCFSVEIREETPPRHIITRNGRFFSSFFRYYMSLFTPQAPTTALTFGFWLNNAYVRDGPKSMGLRSLWRRGDTGRVDNQSQSSGVFSRACGGVLLLLFHVQYYELS